MAATHFLYRAATGRTVAPGPHSCLFCGLACAESVPASQVIRDTFTNHGMCRCPRSTRVCQACDHYFNYRWEVGQKYLSEYRKHSHKVTAAAWESWQREDMRADIERWLREGCPECVLVAALSKKKHCLPLAPINLPGRSFAVQLEEETVQVPAGAWTSLAAAFDRLLALGLTKGAILSGQYHHAALRKSGDVAEVLRLDRAVAPWRPSGLLTLLSYITVLGDTDAPEEAA
jgi:hypothetical protein